MTELEKALSGKNFNSRDEEILKFQAHVKDLVFEFNNTNPNNLKRNEIIKELVTGYNPYVFINSGFQCDFGKNIHFKGMAILNYNCTLLDTNIITIGNLSLIGPNCNLICTNHSLDALERRNGVFNNKPITIGDNVWIGAM